MKRAIILLSLLAAAPLARAQDPTAAAWRDELTENYKILKNTVADQKETIELQRQAIEKLQGDLSDLRKQMAKPPGNFASPDDLKVLKDAIQDEAKKRQADEEKMLTEITKQIGKLAKTTADVGGSPGGGMVSAHTGEGSPPAIRPQPRKPDHAEATPGPAGDESGFKYEVKENDNPAKIARKLFEEKGVRITPDQIMAANPQVKDPTKLYIGEQIFIPVPKSDAGK